MGTGWSSEIVADTSRAISVHVQAVNARTYVRTRVINAHAPGPAPLRLRVAGLHMRAAPVVYTYVRTHASHTRAPEVRKEGVAHRVKGVAHSM